MHQRSPTRRWRHTLAWLWRPSGKLSVATKFLPAKMPETQHYLQSFWAGNNAPITLPEPPTGSRGRARRQGARGRSPWSWKAFSFWTSNRSSKVALFSSLYAANSVNRSFFCDVSLQYWRYIGLLLLSAIQPPWHVLRAWCNCYRFCMNNSIVLSGVSPYTYILYVYGLTPLKNNWIIVGRNYHPTTNPLNYCLYVTWNLNGSTASSIYDLFHSGR